MPARWTEEEEKQKYKELNQLYVVENKTIFEIGKILGVAYQTVYDRLIRLGIPSTPENKPGFLHKRQVTIPFGYTPELAELTGIILGDGHISPKNGQLFITLNSNLDREFIEFVSELMTVLFSTHVSKLPRRNVTNILITSVEMVEFLRKTGLYSSNKVKDQVDVPGWIKSNSKFWGAFLRGFLDTDGSIYKLKFGVQISFTNRSLPLLKTTKGFLVQLGYHPSKISSWHVYLTKRKDLIRYAQEIGFSNQKHFNRARSFGIITSN